MISFAFLLIVVGVAFFIGRPLFAQKGTVAAAKRRSRHAVLAEQRDAVYAAIRELDFDHRMGKVDDEDYRRMRGDFTQQAVGVLKELDRNNGKTRAGDEVEQAVAALRRKGKGGSPSTAACPSCGTRAKPGDRFCAQCGEKVLTE